MNINEITVWKVVGELVKNSIDAQCTVIRVEFNGSFDIRVIDDGYGFDEQTMQNIGERQLFVSDALQRTRFRYGKNGKFLFETSRITTEIYIESIKHNSDVRLLKSIMANKSLYKTYERDRKYKDALVRTIQGSMVVLNSLNLSIGDAILLKTKIVNAVIELALINFQIEISVKDTAAQQTLYESYRTKNLFDKFEHFLESHQFFSKIQSVSCEKHDVKVEILLCDDGTPKKEFQFVYVNKLTEQDGKWRKFINKLCKKRFENDLNSKYPVYLIHICTGNCVDNQLANDVIIDNCIRKCVEQLTPSRSCDVQQIVATTISNHESATRNKAPEEATENQIEGVRLGDWIFNNSCEDYDLFNQSRDNYRKKICENWVISLEKPEPKDVNDSLQSVPINTKNVERNDHLFKKPEPRKIRKSIIKKKSKIKPLSHVSTQIYKPSQHVKAFDNSGLIRESKKLVFKTSVHNKQKIGNKNQLNNCHQPNNHKKSCKNVNKLPMKPINGIDAIPTTSFVDLNDLNGLNDEALKAPIYIDANANKTNDYFQIYRSTNNTMDFTLHKSRQATNFDMNFSSSFAIQTMNENDNPFMDIFGNTNVDQMNSTNDLFGSNGPPATDLSFRIPGSESNRRRGSSVYSEISELRYRHQRNNSVRTQTHYRQRTYCNLSNDSSPNCNRNDQNSGGVTSNRQPMSIQNSSHSGTAVAPLAGQNLSSVGLLSGDVRQTGWPVTININFGQPK